MSPKVVCQQSFFTLPVCPPCASYLLLGLLHLALRPGLHGFLTQAAHLLYQTLLCIIGTPQAPAFGLNN